MTQQDLHAIILDRVKPYLLGILSKTSDKRYSDNELLAIIFKNFRITKNCPTGLRLSHAGNIVLAKAWQSWKFQHTGNITHKAYILLDKNMIWPYYIGTKFITFYSENDASWFKLNGNNISKYSEYV